MAAVVRGGRRRAHTLTRALRTRYAAHTSLTRASPCHTSTSLAPVKAAASAQRHVHAKNEDEQQLQRVASTRDALEVIFTHAIKSVANANSRSSEGAPAGLPPSQTYTRAAVAPCERENARFGDYQCNDAMRVRTSATPFVIKPYPDS